MDDYLNTGRRGHFSINDVVQFLVILLIAKFFKSSGIYLFYDLLKHIHIVQLLFYVTLVASIFFIILQKPFSHNKSGYEPVHASKSNQPKRISRLQYVKIFKYSFFQTLIRLIWLFGLTQCGPLRTTLIFEQSEFAIICGLKAVFLSQTSPSRTRGVVLLIAATLILLAFDYDHLGNNLEPKAHPEGNHHGVISHVFYLIIYWFDVSDHKAGVLLLVFAMLIQISFNQSSLAKVLISDVGGSKRLRALSLLASVLILSPWAIFNLFSNVLDPSDYTVFKSSDIEIIPTDDMAKTLVQHSWLYFLIPIVILSLFIFVIDFYVDAYVALKTDHVFTSKMGALFVFTSSIGLSFVWNHPHLVKIVVLDKIKTIIEQEHALSWGVIISYILYCLATDMLNRPLAKSKGSFIGYSSVGNPLYSLTGETLKRTSMSMVTITKNILREILLNKDSRGIFYFLCLNLCFTFIELGYGVFTNSLGLISDGVHMLFDCSALVMGLAAAVISQWKPTRIYSYGFGRLEILSGFVNGIFLVVISVFVFLEALERLFSPPEIHSGKLIYVSIAGLCVNLFGIFAFQHAHTHGGVPAEDSSCPSHGHSHSKHNHSHSGGSHGHSHASAQTTTPNDNMTGVYLHVLADTLGSVGVIISSFLIQQFGWYIADPVCSIAIAIMIFISVIPLLKHSSSVLLLRTPVNKQSTFNNLLSQILNIEGVVSYRDDHLWQLSSSSHVSTLHVQIDSSAYEQLISAQIHSILKEMKLSNLTVQLEKEVFFQHLAGLGANMGQINESKRIYRIQESSEQNSFINVEKFV